MMGCRTCHGSISTGREGGGERTASNLSDSNGHQPQRWPVTNQGMTTASDNCDATRLGLGPSHKGPRVALTRLDGHPSSGVYPRKDVRSWRAWGTSPGAGTGMPVGPTVGDEF